jgi:hypothetical protein
MLDPTLERTVVAIAHALFMNRLHLLRLTEVVRLGIKPDQEDANLQLPAALDAEMQEQAVNYVLAVLPEEYAQAINQAKSNWLRPA